MKSRNKIIFINLLAILMHFSASHVCHAQEYVIDRASVTPIVDGMLDEWKGNLINVAERHGLRYALSYDKDNLYLAVATENVELQGDILGAGITLTIRPDKGRENEYKLTFPLPGKEDPAAYVDMLPENIMETAALSRYRKIGTIGFKEIAEKYLKPFNPYGIKVALSYDPKGKLSYEEAIPLALFAENVINLQNGIFDIKINGLERVVKIVRRGFYSGYARAKSQDPTDIQDTLSYAPGRGSVPTVILTNPYHWRRNFVFEK